MIKPYDNGGLVSVVDSITHKFLISDTKLRSFIPTQVRKMNPKFYQICGCDICIITKDVQIYLNIFIIRPVIYLQHKYVGRHTRNIFLVLQVMHITNIRYFQVVNFYMLISKILLSVSPLFLLNKII